MSQASREGEDNAADSNSEKDDDDSNSEESDDDDDEGKDGGSSNGEEESDGGDDSEGSDDGEDDDVDDAKEDANDAKEDVEAAGDDGDDGDEEKNEKEKSDVAIEKLNSTKKSPSRKKKIIRRTSILDASGPLSAIPEKPVMNNRTTSVCSEDASSEIASSSSLGLTSVTDDPALLSSSVPPRSPPGKFASLDAVDTVQSIQERRELSKMFTFESSWQSNTAGLPYRLQGDLSLHTPEKINKRYEMKNNYKVQEAISKFWWTFEGSRKRGVIQKDEFVEVGIKLSKTLLPPNEFTFSVAHQYVEADWMKDQTESPTHMTSFQFLNSMFELVDLWAPSQAVRDYVRFTELLFERITVRVRDKHGNWSNKWRDLGKIVPMTKAMRDKGMKSKSRRNSYRGDVGFGARRRSTAPGNSLKKDDVWAWNTWAPKFISWEEHVKRMNEIYKPHLGFGNIAELHVPTSSPKAHMQQQDSELEGIESDQTLPTEVSTTRGLDTLDANSQHLKSGVASRDNVTSSIRREALTSAITSSTSSQTNAAFNTSESLRGWSTDSMPLLKSATIDQDGEGREAFGGVPSSMAIRPGSGGLGKRRKSIESIKSDLGSFDEFSDNPFGNGPRLGDRQVTPPTLAQSIQNGPTGQPDLDSLGKRADIDPAHWETVRDVVNPRQNGIAGSGTNSPSLGFSKRLNESKDVISSCLSAIQDHDTKWVKRKQMMFLRQQALYSKTLGSPKMKTRPDFEIPAQDFVGALPTTQKRVLPMSALLQTLAGSSTTPGRPGKNKTRRASVLGGKGSSTRRRPSILHQSPTRTTPPSSCNMSSSLSSLASPPSTTARRTSVASSPPSTRRSTRTRRRGSTFTPQISSSFKVAPVVDIFEKDTADKDIDPLLLNDSVADAMSKYKHLALLTKLKKLSQPSRGFIKFERECKNVKDTINSMEDELQNFEAEESEKERLREQEREELQEGLVLQQPVVISRPHAASNVSDMSDMSILSTRAPVNVQHKRFVSKFHPVLVVLVKKDLPVPTKESKTILIRDIFTNDITHDFATFRMFVEMIYALCESALRRFHYLTEETILKSDKLHRIFYQEGKFVGPIQGQPELHKVFNFLFSGRAERHQDRKAKAATVRLLFEVDYLDIIGKATKKGKNGTDKVPQKEERYLKVRATEEVIERMEKERRAEERALARYRRQANLRKKKARQKAKQYPDSMSATLQDSPATEGRRNSFGSFGSASSSKCNSPHGSPGGGYSKKLSLADANAITELSLALQIREFDNHDSKMKLSGEFCLESWENSPKLSRKNSKRAVKPTLNLPAAMLNRTNSPARSMRKRSTMDTERTVDSSVYGFTQRTGFSANTARTTNRTNCLSETERKQKKRDAQNLYLL